MIKLNKFFDNWPAKIVSLAVAISLFFFNQFNRLDERPLSIPVTIISNDNYVPASQYPRSVRIVLRGESNNIKAVLENDLVAVLDLRSYNKAGVWRIPIKIDKKGSALGIDPLEIKIDPSDVALSIEKRVVKELNIIPSFRGYLESGFELSGYSLTPSKIEVSGPSNIVDKLNEAVTEPIELSGRSDNFKIKTKVVLKESLVTILSSNILEFQAEVKKAIVYKHFQDLILAYKGLHPSLIVENDTIHGNAKISGSRKDLESYTPTADVLEVDLSSIEAPGTYTLAVSPHFPQGVDVESWYPMTVTVIIKNTR